MPERFTNLLAKDPYLAQCWKCEGKPDHTDTTRSGYDFALTKRALQLGITDLNELAAILALRPQGSVRVGGKGEDYIRRTIAAALTR